MVEPSLKSLQAERNKLWAECRLKGLALGTPERDRILGLDAMIRERKLAHAARSAKKPKLPKVAKTSET